MLVKAIAGKEYCVCYTLVYRDADSAGEIIGGSAHKCAADAIAFATDMVGDSVIRPLVRHLTIEYRGRELLSIHHYC